MTRPVMLNHKEHRDLRIRTGHAPGLGDELMYTTTFPSEFRHVQAHYPIFFHKDPVRGQFQPVAMFGFEAGENLFLSATGWDAGYVPLAIERQPFLIGRQQGSDDLVVNIDLDNPRVAGDGDSAVFLEHGGHSDYLDHINSVLHSIHAGMQSVPAFVAALTRHQLLESFTLDVKLDDGSEHRLAGFYAIHEERLQALDGDVLAELSANGYLFAMYLALASLSQVRELIRRKNLLASARTSAGSGGR